MPGASDKAQHHLEQSVPQLQELLRKEIFTQQEIRSITKKRSDFEHVINARGHHASDYAEYATYELNLNSLIKKRTQRLNVKLSLSAHEGSRKVFFILERGVRKFPADLGLWMQLLGFARMEKARKKLKKLCTDVLRLHPTKSALWVWAANAVLEDEGDMSAARGYLQRGLRFCKRERSLWVEYAKLECIYIARISARRRILGVDGSRKAQEQQDEGEDMLALPSISAEDINPTISGKDDAVDDVALQNLENTPALTGAIPIAIFDAAMKEFDNDAELGEDFFDMVAEFERGQTFDRILRHIASTLEASRPDNVHTITVQFMLPITGIHADSAAFPEAIAEALGIIRTSMRRLPLQGKEIAQVALLRLAPLASNHDVDADIQAALVASIRQWIKAVGSASDIVPVVEKLEESKKPAAAKLLLDRGRDQFVGDVKLNAMSSALAAPSRETQKLVQVGG